MAAVLAGRSVPVVSNAVRAEYASVLARLRLGLDAGESDAARPVPMQKVPSLHTLPFPVFFLSPLAGGGQGGGRQR